MSTLPEPCFPYTTLFRASVDALLQPRLCRPSRCSPQPRTTRSAPVHRGRRVGVGTLSGVAPAISARGPGGHAILQRFVPAYGGAFGDGPDNLAPLPPPPLSRPYHLYHH